MIIVPAKCLRNACLIWKCNVMSSSKINVQFDASKFRLVIGKRTIERQQRERHSNKIYHHGTSAGSCESW